MTPAPKHQKSTDVRSHILDAARRVIVARGFSGVGLTEILASAGVPKGSFYHWFASKESFGSDLLAHNFRNYLAQLDDLLDDTAVPARQRLALYWQFWRDNQGGDDPDGQCLVVKLGAEVSDISEDMRLALKAGTSAIIKRLSRVVAEGHADGSIESTWDPHDLAEAIYQLWLGASVMVKVTHDSNPFDAALTATERLLSGK